MRGSAAAVLAIVVLAVGGCTSGATDSGDPTGGTPDSGVTDVSPTATPGTEVPAEARTAIGEAVDALNATAGHDPADQRAVLDRLVEPDQADRQQDCAPATTTVRFEPSWNDLRPTPGSAAGDGPAGYVLPTLIRVYSDTRITRTDVTALTFTVSGGTAHLPAICIT